MNKQLTTTGKTEQQAPSADDVRRAIDTLLHLAIGELEINLKVVYALKGKGYSPANLLRRYKYDPNYSDAVYTVGKSGTDYRTTLNRLKRCEDRAAKRASIKPG